MEETLSKSESDLIKEIGDTLRDQHMLLAQKSRIQWLADVDWNTDFFHRALRISRSKSRISTMLINEELCEDKQVIKTHIQTFYKQLFMDERGSLPSLQYIKDLIQAVVSSSQNAMLVQKPSEIEVRSAIFELSATSAPGPDSYMGLFFQQV